MQSVIELHQQAMRLAEQAELAKFSGDRVAYEKLTNEAFELESAAARQGSTDLSLEPTRSVLLRSAATLAIEVNRLREAEQLISTALAGNPPDEIADELRDLLEDVYFQRHLKVRGVTLAAGEVQMSLEGPAIGFGIARSDTFVQRVSDFTKLLSRTAERRLGRPFREAGRTVKAISAAFELYISVPRASSFAVTLRLGQAGQMQLPGVDISVGTMQEVLNGLDFINRGDFQALKQSIPDETYRANFVGLAERLAPDGNQVKTVGFTSALEKGERVVALVTPRRLLRQRNIAIYKEDAPESKEKQVDITGTLLEANAKNQLEGIIEVVSADGKAHKITVPRGMMSDIVKPMFEEQVVVTGIARQGRVDLISIDLDGSAYDAE